MRAIYLKDMKPRPRRCSTNKVDEVILCEESTVLTQHTIVVYGLRLKYAESLP